MFSSRHYCLIVATLYPGTRVHFLRSTSSRAFAHTQIQYEDVNAKNAIGIMATMGISINL